MRTTPFTAEKLKELQPIHTDGVKKATGYAHTHQETEFLIADKEKIVGTEAGAAPIPQWATVGPRAQETTARIVN